MMSDLIGNVRDLDASGAQALRALLRSLGHTSDEPGAALPAAQLQKLSSKVQEILGEADDHGLNQREQSSQLLNEDDLPIVDISEPADEDFQASNSLALALDQDLIPLSLLPPDERERQRRERDRLLDLLEEEEHLQQLQEARNAEEERKEAIRKRRESEKAELDELKAARELQKRMGRALVRRAKGAAGNRQEDPPSKPQIVSTAAGKRVSFADVPALEVDEGNHKISIHQPDWGDVTPGRLRSQDRVPPIVPPEVKEYPVKMHVVERHPAATLTSSFGNGADSDDESIPSAGYLSLNVENDFAGEEEGFSSSNGGLSDGELVEEGIAVDTAQHHREIALEYHRKRLGIGAETVKALDALALDDGEHDQQETVSPLSRFRADRMAAVYDESHGSSSTSMGQTVIPASRQKSLQKSVKLGKLENNQLVGGSSGESGSENEIDREIIHMLQAGNIRNVGPGFKPYQMLESPSIGTSTTTHGVRPSKFKVACGKGGAEATTSEDNKNTGDNTRPTISNVVERKVPKSSSQHFPLNKPPPRPRSTISELIPPMTIESPSFPEPPGTSSASFTHPTTTGSPSPHNIQRGSPPPVNSDLSASHDSGIQTGTSTRGSLPAERRVSKFMVGRRK